MMRRTAAERGFTLVEVLVALVVSALLVAIVIDGAALARQRERNSEEKRQAIFLARELIVDAAAAPYSGDARTGERGGLRFAVVQRPILVDPRGLFALILVDVVVRDEDDHIMFAGSTRRVKRLDTL